MRNARTSKREREHHLNNRHINRKRRTIVSASITKKRILEQRRRRRRRRKKKENIHAVDLLLNGRVWQLTFSSVGIEYFDLLDGEKGQVDKSLEVSTRKNLEKKDVCINK